MSKMIFNGLEFVAGQEINNNGMFVDTDNLIDSGTYTSEFTYTAIQDCCLLFHVAGTTSTSGKLYIDGIVFQGIYTNSSDNDFKDYTFLKKGQVAKITSSQNATLEYAVYGLQSGTISNVQHNYSTSEKIIGTWIDGKPIYEKTWEFSSDISCSVNTWIDTPILSDNIKNIIDAKVYNAKARNKWGCVNVHITNDSQYIQIQNTRTISAISVRIVTLQYTKTTD